MPEWPTGLTLAVLLLVLNILEVYMHTCVHAYMRACIHACMHTCTGIMLAVLLLVLNILEVYIFSVTLTVMRYKRKKAQATITRQHDLRAVNTAGGGREQLLIHANTGGAGSGNI